MTAHFGELWPKRLFSRRLGRRSMLLLRIPPCTRAAPKTHESIRGSPGPEPKQGPSSALQFELAYGAFEKQISNPTTEVQPFSATAKRQFRFERATSFVAPMWF